MNTNEELQDLIDNPAMYRGTDIDHLAKELLLLRGSSYSWIKCSDRMPEETEVFGGDDFSPDVLVIDQFEDMFVACTHWGKWIRLKHNDCIISHWMPLPEPPKE